MRYIKPLGTGRCERVRTAVRTATLAMSLTLTGLGGLRAEERELPQEMVRLDETVISGNQELPKVLYILPWQQPRGAPQIEVQAEFGEIELFRRLYPPAYRRELSYFETLHGKSDKEQ